jgi:1-phosphofructokinase family hexose kinase
MDKMILTVTANAALDRVLFIDRFVSTGVMRAHHMVESVGGKGLDTSVVLQTLGAPNVAVSFMAGHTGRTLTDLLDHYGIQHDLVWVAGDTRTANVIVETDLHRHSHIMTPGYSVSSQECECFLERIQSHLPGKQWIVIGGTLPPGADSDLYRRIVDLGHRFNVRSLIDVPGNPVMEALPAKPDIVKMNRSEFASTFGLANNSLHELAQAAKTIMIERNLRNLVITCGADGILVINEHETLIANAPVQQAVNAAGAGDAVSAALVYRLALGDCWQDAMRWASAAGAAVVLTEGTADCHMHDIECILPEVEITALSIR